MPITTDRIARLREFGLSEYAARSYLALLDLGTTEARDVSALSKVPASKIYHILDQLHEKGLVVVLPEFPRKYAPVPFAEYLQRIHDEHEAAARRIREEREAYEAMFAVVGDVAGGDRGGFTVLRGRRNVADRLSELLAFARSSVLLALTPGQAAEPRSWSEPVGQALARRVRVRILAPPETRAAVAAAAPGAEVGPLPVALPAGTAYAIADGHQVLLLHRLPDDAHATEGNDTGVFVDHEGIVALLAALTEGRWTVPVNPPESPPATLPRPMGLMR